jgi:hypothetical protein
MPSGVGLDAAVSGLSSGIKKANEAASKIARDGADPEALADLRQGEHAVQANARTAHTADEALGTLLDVKA